jgi:hypothetical protein
MSMFNQLAKDPAKVETTKQWVAKNSPLIYIFGPSGVGKTSLTSTLFEHEAYRRVLLIDADQGDGTVENFTNDERLCDRRVFDDDPKQRLGWFLRTLEQAHTVECGAIFIEGLTAVHGGLLADELRALQTVPGAPGAKGPALMRCHIGPSSSARTLIDTIRNVKLRRIKAGNGVPIFVTMNTKDVPVDPNAFDSARKVIPDWSANLTDTAMRSADAFLEMQRTPTTPSVTRLLSQKTVDNSFRKLRHSEASALVDRQSNLTLPGLLTLWATTVATSSANVSSYLDQQSQQTTP